jgi:hypothetical protein
VLAALMVTMALSAMDHNIVSTAIPQVVRDPGGSPPRPGHGQRRPAGQAGPAAPVPSAGDKSGWPPRRGLLSCLLPEPSR